MERADFKTASVKRKPWVEHYSPFQGSVQMAELHGRIRHDETKLAAKHAQHSAAARDLVQAYEQILELKRRTRVAVSTAVAITSSVRQFSATFSFIAH